MNPYVADPPEHPVLRMRFMKPAESPLDALLPPRRDTVVHVGGHVGHELESYLSLGFQGVLYVEANPGIFPILQEHLQFWRSWFEVLERRYGMVRVPELRAVQRAAAREAGTLPFRITQHEPTCSLLEPLDPQLEVREEVRVQASPLDAILEEQGIDVGRVDYLAIDAQGAELEVLSGAPRLLERVPAVLVEVNYEPRYRGCPSPEDLDGFLVQRGFTRRLRTGPAPDYPVGDALYLREG